MEKQTLRVEVMQLDVNCKVKGHVIEGGAVPASALCTSPGRSATCACLSVTRVNRAAGGSV